MLKSILKDLQTFQDATEAIHINDARQQAELEIMEDAYCGSSEEAETDKVWEKLNDERNVAAVAIMEFLLAAAIKYNTSSVWIATANETESERNEFLVDSIRTGVIHSLAQSMRRDELRESKLATLNELRANRTFVKTFKND